MRVRNAHDTPGVVEVYEITPDGVAARSGKLREGDLLHAVNDVPVPTHQEASKKLREAEGEVKLKISGRIDADRLCDEVVKFTIPSHHRGQADNPDPNPHPNPNPNPSPNPSPNREPNPNPRHPHLGGKGLGRVLDQRPSRLAHPAAP